MNTFKERLSPKMRIALAPFVLAAAASMTACNNRSADIRDLVDATVDAGADASDASDASGDASDAGIDGSTGGSEVDAGELTGPNGDFDNDGIRNADDACPRVYNATDPVTGTISDPDGDGIPDECDMCPAYNDPTNDTAECLGVGAADADNDGVRDSLDNCLRHPNPDQRDADGDGFGDVCDTCGPNDPAVIVEIIDDRCAGHVVVGTVITGNENNNAPCQHTIDESQANDQGGTTIVRIQDPVLPTEEVADGVDNDCDSVVDNGFDCIDGAENCGPQPVGECRTGVQTCIQGQWSVCDGAVLATNEVLDGRDNDCDGNIDNGFGGRACRFGVAQVDGVTTVVFDEATNSLREVCAPVVPASSEAGPCDGVDNDYDGEIDEGIRALHNEATDTIQVEIGQVVHGREGSDCENQQGIAVCDVATGEVVVTEIHANGPETCGDDRDNDCDGSVDEGCVNDDEVPGQRFPCGSDVGECSAGEQIVDATGARGECVGAVGPVAESCNGKDDDCDGVVDDGFDMTADPSVVIPQGCSVEIACSEDGTGVTTTLIAVNAQEIMDGRDNDCDGRVDNVVVNRVGSDRRLAQGPDGDQLTGTIEPGNNDCVGLVPNSACDFPGVFERNGNTNTVICSADKNAAASENCATQIDDDCNGQVNEGCDCAPGATQNCGPDAVGECAPGAQTCDAQGQWGACIGSKTPSVEVCDGKDNDCNGVADDGFNVGAACASQSDNPECPNGVVVCSQGVAACAFAANNTPELADGVDNDCDGKADEEPKPVLDVNGSLIEGRTALNGAVCEDGVGACAGAGLYVPALNGNAVVCSTLENASAEVPDAIDNDCDRQTDEGFACVPGNGLQPLMRTCDDVNNSVGACEPGLQACGANGQWGACIGAVGPRVENPCDGLDNDCDGETDEGLNANCTRTIGCPTAEGGVVSVESQGTQVCNAQGRLECNAPVPVCAPLPAPAAPSAAPSMGQ